MPKNNSIIWIVLGIIAIFLIGPKLGLFTLFPGESPSGSISILNQNNNLNWVEGDDIIPRSSETGCDYYNVCSSIKGYMIFVNDKLFKVIGNPNNGVHYSQCPEPWGNMYNAYNWCSTWQYQYKDSFQCSASDPRTDAPKWENCASLRLYPGFPMSQNIGKLEAGDNQEVEIILKMENNNRNIWQAYNRFRIHVAPLPCTLDTGQNVVVQAFQSGSTINKNALRYNSYFVKTCSAIPPIIVDSFTKTSYSDLSINTMLSNNQDYIVPSNKVVAIFYVVDNNAGIPIVCGEKAYNPDSGLCEDINAFITVCQEGTFDPTKGVCVVQPGVDYICPEGSRYDTALGVCVYNPPTTIICDIGNYNSNTGKCEYFPDTNLICSIGAYNPNTLKCEYYPSTSVICSQGTYSQTLDACIYQPSYQASCPQDSVYDSTLDKCVRNPDSLNNCVSGYVYNSITDLCERAPETKIICLQGTYNPTTNSCNLIPNIIYSCLEGNLTSQNNQTLCIQLANIQYTCISGFTYNPSSGKCEKEGGYSTGGGFNDILFKIFGFNVTLMHLIIFIIMLIIIFSLARRKR